MTGSLSGLEFMKALDGSGQRYRGPNMAAKASRMALERAKLAEKDIDFIVFATITPDYFFPGSGVLLQRELGLDGRIAALGYSECMFRIYLCFFL